MKKAILVVSFGTSYKESCERTIGAIEREIAKAFPTYEVRRAFTSKVILKVLATRDKLHIDTVNEALEKLLEEGFKEVVIQPTHVMNGSEYEKMKREASVFQERFAFIRYGTPLLTTEEDYGNLIIALSEEIAVPKDTALVFMGHGTAHFANSTYAALDYHMKHAGYTNVFIGTVEGYPDVTTVYQDVKAYGAKKVILYPLMIVTGDHAHNDMAGESEDSWVHIFERSMEVTAVMKGLGEYTGVQKMFVAHVKNAIN